MSTIYICAVVPHYVVKLCC